eukprot:492591_1
MSQEPQDVYDGCNHNIPLKWYEWCWQHNDDVFECFPDQVSKEIENTTIGDTYRFLRSHALSYDIRKISDDKAEQTNITTQYRREVRRFTPSKNAFIQWYWQHNNGSYKPYSRIISQQIDSLNANRALTITANNMKYEVIKLTRNQAQQGNCTTNVTRVVVRRWVLGSLMNDDNKTNAAENIDKYGREETLKLHVLRIALIGAGQVASTILIGMLHRHVLSAHSSITISDPSIPQLNKLYNHATGLLEWNSNNISIKTTTNNKECVKECDIAFLAVRPKHMPSIVSELYLCWSGKEIIVIVPQVNFTAYQSKLSPHLDQSVFQIQPIHDTWPYSAMLVQGKNATTYDMTLITTVLRQMGVILVVDEHMKPVHVEKQGFVAKRANMRLQSIARVILMGVYDDDNIWSCLRGMRYIARDILELACDPSDWTPFIKSDDIYFIRIKCKFKSFPSPRNIHINMMPFVMHNTFEHSHLPKYLQPYWRLIKKCIDHDPSQVGKIGYLTVHESFVDAGRTQRRPGLHVETPGTIYINDAENACSKGAGHNIESVYSPYSAAWGGGSPIIDVQQKQKDGIYMTSSVDESCGVWDCAIENDHVIGHLGDIEHLRSALNNVNDRKSMEPNVMYWLTDRTPHEALPMNCRVYRQFFRLVTSNVSVWYRQHSTPNPKGITPDTKQTRIIEQSKFETAHEPSMEQKEKDDDVQDEQGDIDMQ